MFWGESHMQRMEAREIKIGGYRSAYKWGSDEEDFVNALMSAAWEHHVNRWDRLKMFLRGVLIGRR